MPEGKVFLFGDINVDNLLVLPEIPIPGRDGLASHAETHLGGAVANTAGLLSSLGVKTELIGAIGKDHWAAYIKNELKKDGTGFKYLIETEKDLTGLIFIAVTPDGERTMLSYRGANRIFGMDNLPENILEEAAFLQLSGYVFHEEATTNVANALIAQANERAIPVCLDTGLDPVIYQTERFLKVLPSLSILITGREEAEKLTGTKELGQQMDALLAAGTVKVALKVGAEGAALAYQDQKYLLPRAEVHVKDTTGAGDAFTAGIILGERLRLSPKEQLAMAIAIGSKSTEYFGAARFSLEALLQFLDWQQNHTTKFGRENAHLSERIRQAR
ncbi:MAG: carbohydrate kinase family protein [Anaerolineaceae bacterium]|nr:carbohydrate kinase family protein [Anaerolineaceae bacterium]